MTRVERRQPAPEILTRKGAAKTAADCAAAEANSLAFEADRTIYGHATVKQALLEMQQGKCAYCEVKVHDNPGTIDHFRPSGEVKQVDGEQRLRPGYYWLAYEWENLLLACVNCNQYSKRTLFPLARPELRARSIHDDLSREEPLLINPADDDPGAFVRFREEMIEAIDGNVRGRETIRVLKLNDRPNLVEDRRQRLQIMHGLRDVIRVARDAEIAAQAELLIDAAMSPSGEYRAMMRAAFG